MKKYMLAMSALLSLTACTTGGMSTKPAAATENTHQAESSPKKVSLEQLTSDDKLLGTTVMVRSCAFVVPVADHEATNMFTMFLYSCDTPLDYDMNEAVIAVFPNQDTAHPLLKEEIDWLDTSQRATADFVGVVREQRMDERDPQVYRVLEVESASNPTRIR